MHFILSNYQGRSVIVYGYIEGPDRTVGIFGPAFITDQVIYADGSDAIPGEIPGEWIDRWDREAMELLYHLEPEDDFPADMPDWWDVPHAFTEEEEQPGYCRCGHPRNFILHTETLI